MTSHPGLRATGGAALASLVSVAVAAYAVPALAAVPGIRRRLPPRLNGTGDPGGVALTFDDGPNPRSTPQFLDVLAEHGVRATFFLLGCMVARAPTVARALTQGGHEAAVHGWTHHSLLARGPRAVHADLARTRDLIADTTGQPPRFFRPPYGVFSGPALLAAHRLRLAPVLWTCWGKDWKPAATPRSIVETLRPGLTGGATVLLHDSDDVAAGRPWQATLAALPDVLDACARQGLRVGPLGEHLPPMAR